MADTMPRFHWHTAAFLAVSGLALGLALTGPTPAAPGMPGTEAHAHRWEFRACPGCHDPRELPQEHCTPENGLRSTYARCYLCHR